MNDSEFEFDFDAELEYLLKNKELVVSKPEEGEYEYTESVQTEIDELSDAFYDHTARLYIAHDDSGQQAERTESQVKDFNGRVKLQLEKLIQIDLLRKKFDILRNGEIQVSGEGLFMHSDEANETDRPDVLTEGDVLRGTIKYYGVGPLVPYYIYLKIRRGEYDAEKDGISEEVPGLWISLTNATILDKTKQTRTTFDELFVPVSYRSLKFDKVIRANKATMPQTQSPLNRPSLTQERALINIKEAFAGHDFQELCRDIENDLNHNVYDEKEEARVQWQLHQEDLKTKTKDIDLNKLLKLTAWNTTDSNGNHPTLNGEAVYYNGPTIIRSSKDWRVAHGFTVPIKSNDTSINIHVLPEDIDSIYEIGEL